ncbi:hypothetical protein IAR50_000652 [Cryptococcus sp. DSM 104548]
MAPARTHWQRRVRRLFFFVGTASTFYFLATYLVDRLKESRLRAVREKKQKELLKNHFTSLLSSISFTLYALLPTLRPQISQVFPVEQTSQSLQNLTSGDGSLSNSVSSVGSSLQETTADNSLHLHHNESEGEPKPEQAQVTPGSTQSSPKHPGSFDRRHSKSSPRVPSAPGVGESWASEFQRSEVGYAETETETESGYMVGSSVGVPETDDGLSSVVSQSISLPPTDISSNSPSPPSDLSPSSHFQSPSPPRLLAPPKSKKELWNDLKIQSIARTMTTAYLVPMLYLLTSSQLAILARNTYLKDVKASIDAKGAGEAGEDDEEDGFQTPRRNTSEATLTGLSVDPPKKKSSWLSSFSVDNMGLSDFVESTTSYIPISNPTAYIPSAIYAYLPSIPSLSSLSSGDKNQTELVGEMNVREMERQRRQEEEDAERVFLTYSWWILNVGWKGVAERVGEAVQKVFGGLPLKKELTIQDWEQLLKDVRAEVEMDTASASSGGTPTLFDLTPNILPTSVPPAIQIPFPRAPTDHSPHLAALFTETLSHLHSADGRYLLEKGVSCLTQSIVASLENKLYSGHSGQEGGKKRLAHCLPVVSQWGKSVWEGVPDSGVEGLLGVPEFEGFAALVFGDWASKE